MDKESQSIEQKAASSKLGATPQTEGAFGEGGEGVFSVIAAILLFCVFFWVPGEGFAAKNKDESKIVNVP